jgi:hypothetical protein
MTWSPAASPLVTSQRPLGHLALVVDDQGDGVAPPVARHALLRGENALLVHALLDDRPHEHAGEEDVVRVGEDHAQDDRARGGVHRDVAELQLAFGRVGSPVFEQQLHVAQRSGALELATRQSATQAQQVGARLGHVDVDGIELLDHGQGHRLVGGHHGAHRDRRPADPPGDRGLQRRVRQVDPRALHRGAGRGDARFRPEKGRGGVVVVLLADRVDLDEPLEALGQRPGGREVRLGDGEDRLRLVVGRLVWGGVDLVEAAAGLDVGALFKEPLLDDAVDLRAHLGDQVGSRPTRQLRRQHHPLRVDGDRAHLDRARRGRLWLTASNRRDRGSRRERAGRVAEPHRDSSVAPPIAAIARCGVEQPPCQRMPNGRILRTRWKRERSRRRRPPAEPRAGVIPREIANDPREMANRARSDLGDLVAEVLAEGLPQGCRHVPDGDAHVMAEALLPDRE